MALLASITPRRARKLPLMLIGVTVHALRKLDLEFSIVPGWQVARGAPYRGVREDQRETGLSVICD